MSNLLLQKIVLLRVTEVGKIILKKKRPLLLARSVLYKWLNANNSMNKIKMMLIQIYIFPHNSVQYAIYPGINWKP